jgi:hypothetical protein
MSDLERDPGNGGRDQRVRLAVGGFVVAALVGLALETTVLPPEQLPFGVQSLFIAVGAAAGMWLVAGELY